MPRETRQTILQKIAEVDYELSDMKIKEMQLLDARRFWVGRLNAIDEETKKKLDSPVNELQHQVKDLKIKVDMLVEKNSKKSSSHLDVIEKCINAIIGAGRFASIGKWAIAANVSRKAVYDNLTTIKDKIQKMGIKFFKRKKKNAVEVWIEK